MLFRSDLVLDAKGRSGSSCVAVGPHERVPGSTELTSYQKCLLKSFPAGMNQVTTATWMAATGLADRTFHKARKELVHRGFVESPKKGTYLLTAKATTTALTLQAAATTTGYSSAATAHPPKGVQCGSSLQDPEAI